MKGRQLLMLGGLIASLGLAIFGDRTPADQTVEPVARRAASPASMAAQVANAAPASPRSSAGRNEIRILALRPRAGENGEMKEAGLFSEKNWEPPAPPKPDKPEPPAAPLAPPLPFVYLGRQVANGQIEVFLARGDEVIVVRDQTVIQNTYRVESIGPQGLSLVYLPLGQIQKLSIGVPN
jgi:hypothetical protein